QVRRVITFCLYPDLAFKLTGSVMFDIQIRTIAKGIEGFLEMVCFDFADRGEHRHGFAIKCAEIRICLTFGANVTIIAVSTASAATAAEVTAPIITTCAQH